MTARRIFGPRRPRGGAFIAVGTLVAGLAAAVMAGLVAAHPGHEEEDAFDKLLATLTAQGKPCDEVVEIEDAVDVVIVTCAIRAGSDAKRVVYRIAK